MTDQSKNDNFEFYLKLEFEIPSKFKGIQIYFLKKRRKFEFTDFLDRPLTCFII